LLSALDPLGLKLNDAALRLALPCLSDFGRRFLRRLLGWVLGHMAISGLIQEKSGHKSPRFGVHFAWLHKINANSLTQPEEFSKVIWQNFQGWVTIYSQQPKNSGHIPSFRGFKEARTT
jgi:hypothetical protein